MRTDIVIMIAELEVVLAQLQQEIVEAQRFHQDVREDLLRTRQRILQSALEALGQQNE